MSPSFGQPSNKDLNLNDPSIARDLHLADDLDGGPQSHHHTLGIGVNQAYPGYKGQLLEIAHAETRLQNDIQQLFADDFHSLERWVRDTDLVSGLDDGSWSIQSPSDAEFGSTVFQATAVYHAAYSEMRIPFDPNVLYRVRVRARTIAGAPVFMAGVRPYKANSVQNPGTLPSGNWYGACNGVTPPGAWTEYVGYFKGFSANGLGPGAGQSMSDRYNPGSMPAGTMFIAPMMLPGYLITGSDILQISEYKLEVVNESLMSAQLIANNANFTLTGATVQDITSMTATIQVGSPGEVYLVDTGIDIQAVNANAQFSLRHTIDGSINGGEFNLVNAAANFRTMLSKSIVVTGLAAGARVFKIQGRCPTASASATIFSSSSTMRIVRIL